MRHLVSWCLDRRPVIILATVLVLVGGLFGATQLRQQLFPDFDFPFAIATLAAPGFDATTLDAQVGEPIERSVRAVENVESVTTVASDGQLRLYVELAYGTDTDAAQDRIEKAINAIDKPDAVEDPTFTGGFQDQAVLLATISAKDGNIESLTGDAEKLKAELETVEGVGRVDLAGTGSTRISVVLTPQALANGVTTAQVAEAIQRAQNRTNAGVLPSAKGVPTSLVVQGPDTLDARTIMSISIPGVGSIESVAKVTTEDNVTSGFALVDGKPALSLSVFRETGKDEVTTVDGVTSVLDDAKGSFDNAQIDVLYETASDIRKSIKGLLLEGILGAFFAVVVIYLFLRTLPGTLVAAVSIPTSIVFGLLAAWMLGLTINIITLAGLTIAIGRVIDDGIVVLENIYKHLERGDTRRRAMVDGTGEVAVAIASSTIATAAVFLPIGLVGGLISEIFLSFSIIVTVALLASLLVSVTVIPVIGSFVLKVSKSPHDPNEDRLARMVVPATKFGIKWRWPVLISAIVTMLGVFAAVGAGAIPVQFLPEDGNNQVMGTAQLPPGTTPDDAKKKLAPLDAQISDIDGLDNVSLTYGIPSGNAAFDPSIGSSTAEFFLTLNDGADGDKVEDSLREFGVEQFPLGFTVMQVESGPPAGQFQVNVNADSQEKIAAAALEIEELLNKNADKWGLVEIDAEAAQLVPQLRVEPKPNADVTSEQLAGTLASVGTPAIAGTSADAAIIVSSDTRIPADPKLLAQLPVTTENGQSVPLGSVASISPTTTPAFVNRVDGVLSGRVIAALTGEDVAGTNQQIRDAVDKLDLPDGVELDWDQGDQAFLNEMFRDMAIAMVVAIVLVYFVLVLFFGSIAQPFTILAPIMFSFIGSFGALLITGRAVGLPAMIGQLLLIGIIVSNSILLVDATLKLRRSGVRRDTALIQAAQLRVRPVLMTAFATIAALTPLALGLSGEGGIISASLGTVVIGGLLVATLLTLIIVPAVYRLIDRDRDMSHAGFVDDIEFEAPDHPPLDAVETTV